MKPTKKEFLNDLYLFYRYFIASNYPHSVPAPHIKTLSRKLMALKEGTGKSRLAVSMPPRHKLADSTPILTANRGWTTHGDLKIGDYVFGLKGEPIKIIGVSEKSPCNKLITFTNGYQILAHSDHLWSVYRRGNPNLQTIPTSSMEGKCSYDEKNGKKRYRFQLPLIEHIKYDEIELPIDPYWLGYWLGDGTYNKSCITHAKEDDYFIDVVPYEVSAQCIHNDTGVYTTYFSNDGLLQKLKELNLYENKHIPEIYKKASFEQRIQLLAGLIDSDGNVDERGRVRFINTNKRLIDDVYELCVGLGLYPYRMKPYLPEEINEYKKNSDSLEIHSTKTCYHIGFQPRFTIPTQIPRKKIIEKGLRRRLSITNIETVEPEMGKCIEVEAEDGIYLAGTDLIPTHNSKSSMVTLAFPLWLIFQDPNVNIMIVTGSRSLADKFGIQLREYVRNLGSHFNVYLSDVKQSATHLMFCDKDKKLYRGNLLLANSGGGITGQDADYLILDDPYRGQDEEFTPTALQKKIDWVNRVVEQRIEPHTKYCILHTRWHDIANDTPVYTTNKGWTTHGDLEVGDTLLGTHHRHTRVVKVHPKALLDNCLCFSNGDKIVCGDEHLWKFHDAMNNTTRIFTTYEVMQREICKPNTYEQVFTIPVNRSKCIGLIDCYKVSPRQGNCITVDARDGMYLVGKKLTPTHNSNDLIGYYQKTDPDAYEFVEFPALNEDNEPLWKQRYTTDELLKKKEVVGERVFQSVYQQKPIDMTSDFFNMKHLKYGFPEDYVQESVARAWDIASSDSLSDNDYTAGVKMARFGDYAVILDLIHGRFGSNTKHMIQNTAFMDSPECHVIIETGVAAAGELLHQEWKNQLQGFMVERAKVSGNKSKVDRATPLQNAIEDGKVFVAIQDGPTRQAFYDELNSFPAGEHDDITDATSHVYNYLFMNDDKKEYSARLDVVFL